ncbi:MAG: alpha/beta fold hydrolase [bacterium]|nr:alpha/beta fold hydrolase [bacterium]
MIYLRIAVVSLVIFVFIFSVASAGDVLFETVISRFYSWTGAHWGNQLDGGFTYTQSISITYRPSTDQEVCTIKAGLYKSGSPTDSVVMSVRTSANNGSPIGGPVIASVTVSADQVSGPPFLPQQTVYTAFSFSPCLNLTSNIRYSFTLTRTQQPSASGNYVSQISSQTFYPETSFWQYVPVNGFWQESVGYEPALRLEGPEEPAKTPVLIIPGIAGSELKNGDDLIWADLGQMFLDVNDQFLAENLGLDESGEPIHEIFVNNVIEQLPDAPFIDVGAFNVDTFKSLREDLEENNYTLGQTLFYFPYDWRFDLTDIAPLLKNKIEEIKTQTGSDKVNIVAHSMGGLLVKEYIRRNYKESIDKLVFVGTPHLGAPKAGKIIMEGDKIGIPWLEKDRVQEIGEHSIAVHELLPSQQYFNIAGPYIKQSNNLLDYSQTKQLLINEGSTYSIFNSAEMFFANNLNNLDLSGIDAYNIAGCTGGTQGGYELKDDSSIDSILYRSGDQTVPLISGDGIFLENKFYSTQGAHAELPSRPGVRNLIADILSGSSSASYENISTDISTCGIEGQELIWRSPVEVHIYDSQNRHTGPIENGIEYGISGVDYEIIGHEKFIYLPVNTGETYKVIAIGLDTGTFDLSIRKNEDGNITEETSFDDVPITTSGKVEFEISGNQPLEILIDEDGDGQNDTGYNSDGTRTLYAVSTDKVIRDINLSYNLGWIITEKDRDSYLKKLEKVIKIENKIDKIIETLPDGSKREKRIQRLEKKIDRVLAIQFLKDLEKDYNKGRINERGYSLLKEDIEWLLSH